MIGIVLTSSNYLWWRRDKLPLSWCLYIFRFWCYYLVHIKRKKRPIIGQLLMGPGFQKVLFGASSNFCRGQSSLELWCVMVPIAHKRMTFFSEYGSLMDCVNRHRSSSLTDKTEHWFRSDVYVHIYSTPTSKLIGLLTILPNLNAKLGVWKLYKEVATGKNWISECKYMFLFAKKANLANYGVPTAKSSSPKRDDEMEGIHRTVLVWNLQLFGMSIEKPTMLGQFESLWSLEMLDIGRNPRLDSALFSIFLEQPPAGNHSSSCCF